MVRLVGAPTEEVFVGSVKPDMIQMSTSAICHNWHKRPHSQEEGDPGNQANDRLDYRVDDGDAYEETGGRKDGSHLEAHHFVAGREELSRCLAVKEGHDERDTRGDCSGVRTGRPGEGGGEDAMFARCNAGCQ